MTYCIRAERQKDAGGPIRPDPQKEFSVRSFAREFAKESVRFTASTAGTKQNAEPSPRVLFFKLKGSLILLASFLKALAVQRGERAYGSDCHRDEIGILVLTAINA